MPSQLKKTVKKRKEDRSHLEELKRKKRSKAKIIDTSYRKLVKIKLDINEIEHKIIFLKRYISL